MMSIKPDLLLLGRCATSLALALALCSLARAGAVENAAADIKTQVKSLYGEAVKNGDVWTSLQLEAYAGRADLKLRPILGSSLIYGDPLFAFPRNLANRWDRGDFIGVVSGDHYYQIAADGHPLALSTPLGMNPSETALSFAGHHLGLADRGRGPDGYRVVMAVQVVPNGERVIAQAMPLESGEEPYGAPAVANDGSALAVPLYGSTKAASTYRLAVAVGAKGVAPRAIVGLRSPHGIGSNGAWIIADGAARNADGDYQPVLLVGQTSTPIHSAAVGPGIAAVIAEGKLLLIGKDGKTSDLDAPFALGRNPQVATVGKWLVVASGTNAKSAGSVDLFGNPIGGGTPVPYTLALYRWDDLLANPAAGAARTFPNHLSIAHNEVAALYLWNGSNVSLLDLSGSDVAVRPLATAAGDIEEVRERMHRTRIDLEDGTTSFLDRSGAELWSGPGTGLTQVDRDWLVIRAGATYEAVRMSSDPAKRTLAKLDISGGGWDWEMDHARRRVFADASTSAAAKWSLLDPLTGKAVATNATAKGHAPVILASNPNGRFYSLYARLFDKDLGDGDAPPGERWAPHDAWRLSRTMVVLEQSGRVLVSGKKAGEFLDLGLCNRADHLAMTADQPLVIADDDNAMAGGFSPGASPVLELTAKGEATKPLPANQWRITELRFGSLDWAGDRVGFTPRRLRSPDSASLMVITDSLIIEMDGQTAKLMGKPASSAP